MVYKTRADEWTAEQDGLLINTVLDYITNGKTQLSAFEEVGDMLERTSAAVGFRFNSVIRSKYENEITKARRIRIENKKEKKKVASIVPTIPVVEVVREQPKVEVQAPVRMVKDLIPKNDFPTSDLSIYDSVSDILKKFGAMERELRELKKENDELKAMMK